MAVIIKGKNAKKPHTVRYWVDGKQRERSFATAGEAKDWKIKVEHDARAQIFVDPKLGNVKFGEYASKWIESYPCADQTRKGMRLALNKHLRPLLNRTLADVAKDHEGISELLQVVIPKTAPTVVKRCRTIILAVMDLAVVQGKIPGHKLGSIAIDYPGHVVKPFTLATQAQLQIMADGIGIMIWLMHGLGLRIEEAIAVNINGFRENGTVYRVSEQATRDGKETAPLKARRLGEFRDVPVPAWLWAMVKDAKVHADGYLIKGARGRFPSYGAAYSKFRTYAKDAGLPKTFTPHSIRHGYASTLLAAHVPITDLAQWLGHRDIRETYATYGHLVPSAWSAGREALEQAWAA
jgi:integrase